MPAMLFTPMPSGYHPTMDIMATYTVEAFMASYAWGSWKILAISALTFFFGYMEYVYSFRLVAREKSAPYPMWMHTFYFAHDFTGVVVFGALALKYHFWFFYFAALALVIWNGFEIYNMYKGIELERQEIWGTYYEAPVTRRQALGNTLAQVVLFFAVVNLARVFMADVCMFKLFAITNIVMAIAPGFLWARRKDRTGTSMGLAIIILLATINTFLPGINMWALMSPYFDQPWYYLMGLVCVGFATRNLLIVKSKPAKVQLPGGKKPIW
jgi:hypothetical protein